MSARPELIAAPCPHAGRCAKARPACSRLSLAGCGGRDPFALQRRRPGAAAQAAGNIRIGLRHDAGDLGEISH